ncbi:MAG: GNAT family protein [Caldilineaceae bacterium]
MQPITMGHTYCDERNGTFSCAFRIFRPYRRQGYARETFTLLLKYGFHELRYQKANTETIASNDASIQLHRSLGFREEGRRRHNVFTDGQYFDEILFGMTREEFDALHGTRNYLLLTTRGTLL